MPDRLYWSTVKPLLKETLASLMKSDLFQSFRLVGGTSLSLQLGHRMSDDIDLFTDLPYGSVDFQAIDKFLRASFRYVSDLANVSVGMGVSYLVGNNKDDVVKLDLYYTDPFIQPARAIDFCRLATRHLQVRFITPFFSAAYELKPGGNQNCKCDPICYAAS